ncbi:SGNH/GDSL hydrolase family protein [Luedemannella flava]
MGPAAPGRLRRRQHPPLPTGTAAAPTPAGARAAIDFVGTRGRQACPTDYPREYPRHDGDNEGHGGITAERMVADNALPGWLERARPRVVLMHLGTNDVWRGRTTRQVLDAYTALVAQLRAADPAMVVLVAQILPMDPPDCPSCAERVTALNRAIPAWVNATSTPASPVLPVDLWTGFDTAKDTSDGVHPVWSGNEKIAARWFAALEPVLAGMS